ncbi:MAG: LemA family protein [Armatimonadetes bacterium]|nr:LemA family protein [Armatimonadota bacterium]
MASSEYTPRPSSQQPESKPLQGYSDDEARDIYARAAEIQSQTAFEDDKLTPEMLSRSANRAGISDAAVQQAIKERERDRQLAIQRERERAAQKAVFTKRLLITGAVVAALSGVTLFNAQGTLGARPAKVESTQAQVENVLERRHNLIPNLINVTKSTLQHERALIDSLNAANEAAKNAPRGEAKLQAETQLSGAVSEALTKLANGAAGSSPQVLRLSDEMAGAENRIAVERKKYNEAVAEYNRAAAKFPTSWARAMLGYRARYDTFKASPAAQQAPVFPG